MICDVLDDDSVSVSMVYREKYGAMTNTELRAKLCEVDPASARRLHPNNRRKIER